MRNILLAAIIIYGAISAQAQSGPVGFTYGLYAGITSTDFSTNIDYEDKTKGTGITVRAFTRFKIIITTIQPEIAYSLKNVSFTANDTVG